MRKIKPFILLSLMCLFVFSSVVNAADETLTITTYYPSPYGSYNNLSVANKLGVGTASPGYPLTIGGYAEGQSSPRTAIAILGPNSPGGSNSRQDIRWLFASAGTSIIGAYRGSSWDNYIVVLTSNSSAEPSAGVYIGNAATAWSAASDIRLKENIQTITNALQKIESIRGVSFDFKRNHKHQLGLIAQEVNKNIPEVVDVNPADGYLGIRYTELIPVLVEGVKEQQRQIEELKREIQELKKKRR
jgi:hypothetical protein